MRRETMETGLRRARDIRVALSGLLVLSMTVNLALGVGLANREAVTVLVPATVGPCLDGRRWPGGRAVSGGHGAHRRGDAAHPHPRERGVRARGRGAVERRRAPSAPGWRAKPGAWPAAT